MKEKKAEVLGLTRNNAKYKNVPDDLKWAIPLIEIQRDPAFIALNKQLDKESEERVKKEMAAKRRPFRMISDSDR